MLVAGRRRPAYLVEDFINLGGRRGVELVTADLTYYRKARFVGSIRRLSEISAILA